MSAGRRAAWEVLGAWLVADRERARLGTSKRPFPPASLAPRDRAFARELAEGVVRRVRTLDAVLERLTGGRKPRPSGLRAALLLAAYELLFDQRSGAHAIVHEAVEFARRAAGEGGARFANAVLRRLSEAPALEDWVLPPAADDVEGIAQWFSLPDLVVRRWRAAFGSEQARALFEHASSDAPRSLRVRRGEDMDEVERALRERGHELARGPAPRSLLVTGEKGSLLDSPEFAAGRIALQDCTQIEIVDLVLDLAAAAPGARVLDFCAAPGTKTCAIAEGLGDSSRVVAHDVQPERLARVRSEAERLRVADRVELAPELDALERGGFELVLVDAPCSNSGVFARRAEARWRLTEEALAAHVAQQEEILREAASFVAPGGALVYATCSIEEDENEALVRRFAESVPFRVVSCERSLPETGLRDGGGVAVLRSLEEAPADGS